MNKALAEKIIRSEQKAKEKELKKKRKRGEEDGEESGGETKIETGVLSDPRFKALFENPEFEVDEESREFAMLNPAQVHEKGGASVPVMDPNTCAYDSMQKRPKTAVEEEEDESDVVSSDGLSHSDEEGDGNEDQSDSDDSSDAGGVYITPLTVLMLTALLLPTDLRLQQAGPSSRTEPTPVRTPFISKAKQRPTAFARNGAHNQFRSAQPKMVAMSVDQLSKGTRSDKDVSFGERRKNKERRDFTSADGKGKGRGAGIKMHSEGGMEMSWVPGESGSRSKDNSRRDAEGRKNLKRKGVEQFGLGMERGGGPEMYQGEESERNGRTHRRKGVRSGSRNVFRRM